MQWHQKLAKRQILRETRKPFPPIDRLDWPCSLADPTAFYLRCFRYFHFNLPEELKLHRTYFAAKRRGFGEDAFHAMWFLLFNEFRPESFLEIGVYRGQTLSLAALLQKRLFLPVNVVGISPFSSAGDMVSRYRENVDYKEDTIRNFKKFQLPPPTLLEAYSTDPAAIELIRSKQWDCIYIDGNHDYEIVRKDWMVCSESLRLGGVVVLDDASLTTAYAPPIFSTKGHPGPSAVADEIKAGRFREILRVGHNRVFEKVG
jgi:SAM-dependent methyltransferase